MNDLEQGDIKSIHQRKGSKESQRPESGNLAEIIMPEMRCCQREDGNGQQHRHKRCHPPYREVCTIKNRRALAGGK